MREPLYEFFLVCLPGFEDLCEKEVRAFLPQAEAKSIYGGVSVSTTIEQGLALNYVLKIPTRILLRIGEFKCRDFPKLFKVCSEFSWHKFIHPNCEFQVVASSKSSRLKIKKRIEETVLEALKAYQAKRKARPNRDRPMTVYIRIADDTAVLSLDTSGERLHKRGLRKLVGESPLRVTFASALLQNVEQTYESVPKQVVVADVLAGSGVFLIEALTRFKSVSHRPFTFSSFNCLKQEVSAPEFGLQYEVSQFLAFEENASALKSLEQNFSGLSESVSPDDLSKVRLIPGDFLKGEGLGKSSDARQVLSRAGKAPNTASQALSEGSHGASSAGQEASKASQATNTAGLATNIANPALIETFQKPTEVWSFCNPPYGERLKVSVSLSEFYRQLFLKTEQTLRPTRACFLLPSEVVKGKLALPSQWKVLVKRKLSNGGIPVTAFIFGRESIDLRPKDKRRD